MGSFSRGSWRWWEIQQQREQRSVVLTFPLFLDEAWFCLAGGSPPGVPGDADPSLTPPPITPPDDISSIDPSAAWWNLVNWDFANENFSKC